MLLALHFRACHPLIVGVMDEVVRARTLDGSASRTTSVDIAERSSLTCIARFESCGLDWMLTGFGVFAHGGCNPDLRWWPATSEPNESELEHCRSHHWGPAGGPEQGDADLHGCDKRTATWQRFRDRPCTAVGLPWGW